MRIAILPSNPTVAADPGGAKPECEKAREGGSFLAVMGQMTTPEETGGKTEAEDGPCQVENDEDRRDGSGAAPAAHPLMIASGNLAMALETTSASAPAAPTGRCANLEAGVADGDAIPEQQGPAIETETQEEASAKPAGKPISGSDGEPANPASIAPATAAYSSSDAALSVMLASESPEKRNAAAQLSRKSVAAAANPAGEVELLPQTVPASASGAESVEDNAEVTPVTPGDAPAVADTDRIAAIPSCPPGDAEKGRLSAHAKEDPAPGSKSVDGVAVISLPPAEAAADADLPRPLFVADAITQVQTRSALAGSDVSAGRGNPREERPAAQRAPTLDERSAVLTTPKPTAETGQTHAESALGAVVFRSEQPQENLVAADAAVKTLNSESAREAPAKRREPSKDSFEHAWTDTQVSTRVTSQNSTARSGSADVPVLTAARLWSRTAATIPASWEAGFQLPHQAAGTDLKSVLALLAPRQSAPAASADFLSQLAGRIQMQLHDHQNILIIQLKPSFLGRMEIKAETSAAGVLATILTESASVKDFLEHNLSQLQQSFQEQGLKIDRISVEVQEGIRQQPPSPGQQEARSSGGRHDDPGTHAAVGGLFREPEEEMALDVQTLLSLKPHSTFHVIA